MLQDQGCVDAKLLKTEHEEILYMTFPLPSAHSGHSLKSLSDMHSYQPLPEVIEWVESLVSNSYLSQVSLKLALHEWVSNSYLSQVSLTLALHEWVSNSYLSQVSLTLALHEWVSKELIPLHIQKRILNSIPSQFDRHYHPASQDLRNITRSATNKLRRHTFDQDALQILLEDKTKQHTGFQYFLWKYKT